MQKLLALTVAALLIFMTVSCSISPELYTASLDETDTTVILDEPTTAFRDDEQKPPVVLPEEYVEVVREIYLCTDVYITDDTPTHGSGVVTLPLDTGVFKLQHVAILLCDDGCESIDVMSRTSEGYARTHDYVFAFELKGEHTVLKYTRIANSQMVESLKKQGVYEEVMAQFERNYFYLIVLNDTHYVYVQLECIEEAPCASNEEALADEIVRNAKVTFDVKK